MLLNGCQGTYNFPFDFTCLFYLLVDGLMYACVIMRDNSSYLLVNQLIVGISYTFLVKTRL